MPFELWNAETATILGSYGAEQAAAFEIREAVKRLGDSSVNNLALALEDEMGDIRPVAAGAALRQWAESTLAEIGRTFIERHRRIA